MIFTPTDLAGAYLIDVEPITDDRGFFARSWCRDEFEEHGLNADLQQCNIALNLLRGTVRGMHFQRAPHAEAKLVRVTAGAIHDVLVDLRPDSATFKEWRGYKLSSRNRRWIYVPEGFAHGYQTLEDDTEVLYQVTRRYAPASEGGVCWDDPAFDIEWPGPVTCISPRDRGHPPFGSESTSTAPRGGQV